METPTPLYPLRFKEILRNYAFGNRWIVDAYEKTGLPDDHRVAETWEVCDRPGESSEVINGPLAGETLHDLITRYGVALLGRDVVARCGMRFPLLIKFLDASHTLGEQAHHSDPLAAQRGLDDPGKTEAWYMLKVRDGASIRCGARPGVTAADVHDALMEGTIRSLMQPYEVAPGDAFLLHAGTMHYSAGGVLFYEIMQNSDVYIGLADPPPPSLPPEEREAEVARMMEGVHLESGYECKTQPVVVERDGLTRRYILACQYFALERWDFCEPVTLIGDSERFYVLSQIEGEMTIETSKRRESLRPGQSCLLPADLGEVLLSPVGGSSTLLRAYLPDLTANVVRPLREAGIADEVIGRLGGRTCLNPLLPLLEDRESRGETP
jgi:mannose-6-phosphate isomerase